MGGLQGESERYLLTNAGCKHYAGFAGPLNSNGDHAISERDLQTTFLPQFRACVEAGAWSFMCEDLPRASSHINRQDRGGALPWSGAFPPWQVFVLGGQRRALVRLRAAAHAHPSGRVGLPGVRYTSEPRCVAPVHRRRVVTGTSYRTRRPSSRSRAPTRPARAATGRRGTLRELTPVCRIAASGAGCRYRYAPFNTSAPVAAALIAKAGRA